MDLHDKLLNDSYNGLSSGKGPNTPLRDVRGWLVTVQESRQDDYNNTFVELVLSDIEVIEAVAPYEGNDAAIELKYSERRNSGWGILLKSLENFLGPGATMGQAVAKRVRVTYTPGHDLGFADKDTKQPVKIDAWEFTECEQPVQVSEDDVLVALATLADGMTQTNFNRAALNNEYVKKSQQMQDELMNGQLVLKLVGKGLITQDAKGVYKRN